jgi:hypothetical protein
MERRVETVDVIFASPRHFRASKTPSPGGSVDDGLALCVNMFLQTAAVL